MSCSWTTPAALAKSLLTSPDKICDLIHSGQLPAVNIAMRPHGSRARWRIKTSDVDAFLARRSTQAAAPKPRRQQKPVGTIQFYK